MKVCSTIGILSIVMVGAGARVLAQTPTVPAQTPSVPAQSSKVQPTTLSGCVAAQTGGSGYQLTNATINGADVTERKTAPEGGQGGAQVGHAAMTGGHTYELVGGDVKAHVGHKVEVTGIVLTTGKDVLAKTGTPEKAPGTTGQGTMAKEKMTSDGAKSMRITVASVKMISATCP